MKGKSFVHAWAVVAVAMCGIAGCAAGPRATSSPPEAPMPARGLAGAALWEQAEQGEDMQPATGAAGAVAGVSLNRGVLFEDDAPAFGPYDPQAEPGLVVRRSAKGLADGPFWEPLSRKTQARKTLMLDPFVTRDATLCVFAVPRVQAPPPIRVTINRASPLTLPAGEPGSAPRWLSVGVPERMLRGGANEFVLSADSDTPTWSVLIAARDVFARGATKRTVAGRSHRSADGGKTWSDRLGRDSSAAGEYAVRLAADQFALAGRWMGPVMDLATQPDDSPIGSPVTFKSAFGQIDADVPTGARIDWEFRAGSVATPNKDNWGKWSRLTVGAEGRFTLPSPSPRYVQLQARLATADPSSSPVLRAVHLKGAAAQVQPAPAGTLRVTQYDGPRNVAGTLDFACENMPLGRLNTLDQRFGLAQALTGSRTQFETAVRTLGWLSPPGGRGLFVPGQIWNAADILATRIDQPTQSLPYQIVLCQALHTRGITARLLLFTTHDGARAATEFWSTDYGQWVLADGQAGEYYLDAATGVPLSAMQLRSRVRGSGQSSPPSQRVGVRVARAAATLAESAPLPGWLSGQIYLIPRNNFISADKPVPLHPESMPLGWSGFVPLTDGPPQPWMPPVHLRPRDAEWTLNQAAIELQHGKSPGELWVCLHTQTPGFESFQANEGTGFRNVPAGFRWVLAPGPNRLEVRVRNRGGAVGPMSVVAIRYVPPPSR